MSMEQAGSGVLVSDASVRTFFVFTDLPFHYEYRAQNMPLLPKGVLIEFDLDLRDPERRDLMRRVDGPYVVSATKVVYSTKRPSRMGLTQFLELSPAPKAGKGAQS